MNTRVVPLLVTSCVLLQACGTVCLNYPPEYCLAREMSMQDQEQFLESLPPAERVQLYLLMMDAQSPPNLGLASALTKDRVVPVIREIANALASETGEFRINRLIFAVAETKRAGRLSPESYEVVKGPMRAAASRVKDPYYARRIGTYQAELESSFSK